MSYLKEEFRYISSDGKNSVYAEIYLPADGQIKGVIQISHGMVDHIGRYYPLAEYFCQRGYAVAGNHHLGHGKTAACKEDLGYFGDKNNIDHIITDLSRMNFKLRERFPGQPIFLLGHSMGSFIARLYALSYSDTVDGLIIHGTAGPNKLIPLGKAVAGIIKKLHGPRYRSGVITAIAFGSYNKRFPKEQGKNAWLTRDVKMVESKGEDGYSDFVFTVSAYRDLFEMISRSNSKRWFADYPKELPTLIISGTDDPVGGYGKGVETVKMRLIKAGHKNLTSKMYQGARHELFNETNRDEVFADIYDWVGGTAR